ncbi:uncharacterized protein LOC121907034 [Scomber scombrus]|uniref:Uncharacterized protein LOC121907034 n=1 Tax=Scomber scombrus TaxID=13677 RepID=A0AAV1N4I8_SCOSC
MHILLTTGGMEDLSRYLGVNWTFSLICFVFWIFSPAEGYRTISSVGSKVVLPCNESGKFQQLTWKMNGVSLYSFSQEHGFKTLADVVGLNIGLNRSVSGSEQWALVMEQVQKSHAGNYTCEVTTPNGPRETMWELIVTAGTFPAEMSRDELVIIVAAIVPGVCCLVFIFSLTCLRRVCKRRANHQFPTTVRQAKTEDIYENCLQTRSDQPSSYNPTHLYEV